MLIQLQQLILQEGIRVMDGLVLDIKLILMNLTMKLFYTSDLKKVMHVFNKKL